MAELTIDIYPFIELKVLKNIQRECKNTPTCTGCRFFGEDEDGDTVCRIQFPELWRLYEDEAKTELVTPSDGEKDVDCDDDCEHCDYVTCPKEEVDE